jgi:hypothetical protein
VTVQSSCLLLLSHPAFFVRSASQGHSFANQFDPTPSLACVQDSTDRKHLQVVAAFLPVR